MGYLAVRGGETAVEEADRALETLRVVVGSSPSVGSGSPLEDEREGVPPRGETGVPEPGGPRLLLEMQRPVAP